MRVRSFLLFVSLGLALVSQLAIAQDSVPKGGEYVTFPSVGVEMTRPNGFTVAERFVGFGLEEELASILIVSLPGAYEELAAGMTEARFAKKGVLVAKREQIQVSGRNATLLHARQRSPELDFTKWLLLLDGDTSTKLITATVPTSTATFLGRTMTASLMSTRVVATAYVPPDVGFTLTPSKMLKPRTELAGVGKVLAYVGSGPPKAAGTPQFIATPSVGAFEGPDREQFAVDRAMALATIGGIFLQSTKPVRIDGLEGYEVVAKGKDLKTKAPLVIYQVMLFEPDGNYYLMVGIVEKKRAVKLMPAFKAMAKSFKRTK
jgi:hypothetical protein